MANLPDICVALKIYASEYQPYACGKIFHAPFYPAWPLAGDLEQICLFLDGHGFKNKVIRRPYPKRAYVQIHTMSASDSQAVRYSNCIRPRQ